MPDLTRPELLVVGSGAVGGGISMVLPLMSGIPGIQSPAWWMFIASIPIGAVAAFIGVFLLFNTDRTDKQRLCAWAVILGMFWQPVVVAAQTLVQYKSQQQQLAKNANAELDQVDSILKLPSTTGPASRPSLERARVKIDNVQTLLPLIHDDARRMDLSKKIAAANHQYDMAIK